MRQCQSFIFTNENISLYDISFLPNFNIKLPFFNLTTKLIKCSMFIYSKFAERHRLFVIYSISRIEHLTLDGFASTESMRQFHRLYCKRLSLFQWPWLLLSLLLLLPLFVSWLAERVKSVNSVNLIKNHFLQLFSL